MYKRILIAFAIILAGVSFILFNSFYKEAEKTAIGKLREEQTIHARQAARGIEDFFATWTRNLNTLSKMDVIIADDAAGKRYIKLFYEANHEQIKSITRLDEKGVILYNFPSGSSAGTDISDQKHVRELLLEHKPVISDVFRAVEGFDSVAIHVPVFKGLEFIGSIGILINFESLAKRYLDVIKIGETGYAWVISRDGTQLYSPIPGFTGKPVLENIKDYPSLIVMVNDMLRGHEGAATYTFDRIGDRNVGQTRKYAVYMPVRIGNTFWSIAVASAEQDVLSGLISFRNKLVFVIGAIFICGMVFSALGAKAWLIVNEEEKRRKIENELRESEARMRDITFNMADWVWGVDEKGVYTYSSAKGLEFFGHVEGKTPFDFMPPDEAKRVAEIFTKIAANKEPINDLENWNIRKDGERICLLTNGVPILDKEGNLKGYRGVDRDITKRKRMEGQLRTTAEEWHKTFNTIQDLIMIMDLDFRIVKMNDATMKFFGLPREKIIGMHCFKLMHGTESQIEGCPYKKMMDTRNHEETEVYDELRNKWFRVVVDPFYGTTGDIIGVVHTVKDITENKLAEAARMESMARYQAVVEAFDGLIYICSPDYRMEFMNQRLIDRTGRNAVGEVCYKVLHDRDSVCEWCVNERVFQGETVRWEVQSPKDHCWYYVVNTPIRHADGTMSKQSMILDITERKQAEEVLKETAADLKHSQKDLRKLAGRLISAQEEELRRLSRELHDDLTQRLAVLAIEAGKLELGLRKIPEPCQETLETISGIKDQLIKVSEDVHNISRQLHPTILDDLGLVLAIESECAALMRREDIEIIFSKEDVPAEIANDIALCLYRVLQESLKNIITHSRATTCEIFLDGVDNMLCLTVSDNGIGFDPSEVRYKSGLGLSSMRERAQLVQGDFAIKSRSGQGTIVRIGVPLKAGVV